MSCKECEYFEYGWCNNLDTIKDPGDEACIAFDYKKEEEEKKHETIH